MPPAAGKRWLPLECNPQVLNDFSHAIGASEKWGFHDVYSTDPELLASIPTPVVAVMLLFPISEASEAARASQITSIERNGQTVSPDLWFSKQTIGNACGTMGVLHALCNTGGSVELEGWVSKFLQKTLGLDPEQRAVMLEQDEELDSIHAYAAHQGQTRPPTDDESVMLHFVVFVHCDGCIYELDGRKPCPINMGPTSPGTLLNDAVAAIQQRYISVDPENVNFNAMALAPQMQG